ncbi:MAG: preprotein translocase subunit SecE [Chromatiales bacterium]|jgi:preprotein translocase subunit SecE|nr:preprotein translocase subunit SecE [Chromatiales bacterium]
MSDKIKFLLVALIVIGAIAGFYYFGNQPMAIRVIGLLMAAAVAAAVLLQTAAGKHTWAFIGESRTEVRKIVWPTRKETTQTTAMVMVMVVVSAAILWLFDSILTWIVKIVTGQGS